MTSTKYIGMDVHKESISIQVMNSVGKVVMECGQPSGLLFQKTTGAATTAKWNHREEEAYLCFARGDETRHFA